MFFEQPFARFTKIQSHAVDDPMQLTCFRTWAAGLGFVLRCRAEVLVEPLGGWRIVHTMGSKITKLTPMQGFCAETGGAITLFLATGLGIPVSTTHTITGAIVGVGAARRVSAVRWNIAKNIVVAWVITMPMAGIIAAIFYALARLAG